MITLHDCEILFIVLGYYMFWEILLKLRTNIGISHIGEILLRQKKNPVILHGWENQGI